MKGYLSEAIFSKFGIGWRELVYEESERRVYMQFFAGSSLYFAVMLKGGEEVSIYKLEKAVSINED